jgi:hypothetical protein
MQTDSRLGIRERPLHRWWIAALPKHMWFILILFSASLMVIVGFFLARTTAPKEDFATMLLRTSRSAVILSLREELHLKTDFSDAQETSIVEEPTGKFLVRGWVDLIAENGRMTRQSYSCVLQRNSDGEWVANDIMVVPH